MKSPCCSKLVFACTLLVELFGAAQAFADDDDKERCADARSLRLVNGNIVTMDADNSVVSSVTIRNGRIAAVGNRGDEGGGRCTRVIDLHGRTAIPGLVDNHNHIVLLGIRPGHDVRLESAASIAEVQELIRERTATVPPGEFITAIGGWNPVQFAEKRLPTLAELDLAAPQHPVYVQQSFTGPSATNSLGKAFFETRGVAVSAAGAIAANAPTLVALNALRAIQTFEDRKRGTLDAVAYGAGLGVTTHFDMGGFVIPGTPHTEGSFLFDGAASWNPYTAYDAFLQLQREGKLPVRLRVFFLSMDTQSENPLLTNRVLNAFREFGGDMMKIVGLGEFITAWPLFGPVVEPPNYAAAVRMAAERGWIYQQHTLSLAEDQFTTSAWERLNGEIPIADLHWSIAHALTIDQPTVKRLKAMGAGLALHGFRYLAGTPAAKGPPYRMIVDSGIRVGAGSDSAQISTLNPWLMIYYMVTGKNSSGVLINAGQTLTRLEALRLYTAANGWFSKEEDLLGSIEVGKYGDVVVLSDNFLDPRRVSDEAIKRMRSVLTIVGGKIVHDEDSDRDQSRR
jgi:predicted amidohydrolase YtcJ